MLDEIERSVAQLEKQCETAVTTCQERRPKKTMNLFVCTFIENHN